MKIFGEIWIHIVILRVSQIRSSCLHDETVNVAKMLLVDSLVVAWLLVQVTLSIDCINIIQLLSKSKNDSLSISTCPLSYSTLISCDILNDNNDINNNGNINNGHSQIQNNECHISFDNDYPNIKDIDYYSIARCCDIPSNDLKCNSYDQESTNIDHIHIQNTNKLELLCPYNDEILINCATNITSSSHIISLNNTANKWYVQTLHLHHHTISHSF